MILILVKMPKDKDHSWIPFTLQNKEAFLDLNLSHPLFSNEIAVRKNETGLLYFIRRTVS